MKIVQWDKADGYPIPCQLPHFVIHSTQASWFQSFYISLLRINASIQRKHVAVTSRGEWVPPLLPQVVSVTCGRGHCTQTVLGARVINQWRGCTHTRSRSSDHVILLQNANDIDNGQHLSGECRGTWEWPWHHTLAWCVNRHPRPCLTVYLYSNYTLSQPFSCYVWPVQSIWPPDVIKIICNEIPFNTIFIWENCVCLHCGKE